jgi:uncharacterized iron-regulated membrane protein
VSPKNFILPRKGEEKVKKTNWKRLWRRIHYWIAIITAIPVIIVIVTGIILQFKKQSDWIQPPSMKGISTEPAISMEDILEAAKSVPEAEVESWDDIERLDVRPGKGIIKIRPVNLNEIQIDHQTGEILQIAYRRSDILEDMHTGAYYLRKYAQHWIFVPAEIGLGLLWLTGMYMFFLPYYTKWQKNRKKSS